MLIQITYGLLKYTVAFKGVFKSLNLSIDARNAKTVYKPTYSINDPKGDPSLDGKMMYRMTEDSWALLIRKK
jgi:hypothetical protein